MIFLPGVTVSHFFVPGGGGEFALSKVPLLFAGGMVRLGID